MVGNPEDRVSHNEAHLGLVMTRRPVFGINENKGAVTAKQIGAFFFFSFFLAHLSRRLIGELIVYQWSAVRRPSVVHRRRRSQCSKIFSETAGPIKVEFYVEPPWVGGTIFCSRHLGNMTKMAATPIYGKNPSNNLLLQNLRADFHETWYVASGTPAHYSLFK